MKLSTPLIILALLGSLAGGVFILKKDKEIVVENTPVSTPTTTTAAETAADSINNEELVSQSEELIAQAQNIISETQKFIEEEGVRLALLEEMKRKSDKIKGIYAGRAVNQSYLKALLDETELNAMVIDVKEAYGQNLPASLKTLIKELHKKDVWLIARIVVFRDSSLVQESPDWYLVSASTTNSTTTEATSTDSGQATSTISLWRDKAEQYWFDPKNSEAQDYIIEFSKKVIDYGFDELQFDYIRYPDDYGGVSGDEKIKVIGDFFEKLSDSVRTYKPSVILSADLFGYVATQFNSYGIGQRLFDAGKYFDYISFMLYPSHFYGGFAAKGVVYTYPEVVKHPYDVVYYSIDSANDYLSAFDLKAKIRPWLQDFDLKVDRDREVFYDAEKVRLQIEAAQNATSSGWLLWNPSYTYIREALASSTSP